VTTLGLFVGGLALVLAGAELFTNAIEWAGFRLRLASGATGSLLAALGTALPETIVPVVAIVSRQPTSDAIAVGAVIGAPFLLLTLGTAVTGLAVVARRGAPDLVIDPRQARRDLGTFLVAFALVLLGVVLPVAARAILAVAVLVVYGIYVRATLRGGVPTDEAPEPLHLLRRRATPHGLGIVVQLVAAIASLVVGAELFVHGIERAAAAIHLPPLLLSLILVPLATELPETLNSVLWVRSRDDGLAFGNVAGATAFQACLPGALGLTFTTWRPGALGIANGLASMACALWALLLLRDGRCRGWRLASSGLVWLAYVVVVVVAGNRLE
jgi:cation:H+ antiporter